MFLSDQEIEELTHRLRKPAQARVLTFMGIEHKPRPDGSLAVLRSHVERVLGEGAMLKSRRKTEPCLDLVK